MFKKIVSLVFILFIIGCTSSLAQEGTVSQPDTTMSVKPSAADTAKPDSAKPATAETAGPALTAEAEICTGIDERMPTGTAESFPADVGKVYLWCKIQGATDSTMVRHVWYRNGEEMATVELPVKSPAWRTWSSKNLLPEWTGAWEVKILDADGNELASVPFQIVAAQPETE
jgi:hypothetical protein